MTAQDLNKRRALIVRRWAAYRVSRAQREIWRRRRAAKREAADDLDEGFVADALAELPDTLVG